MLAWVVIDRTYPRQFLPKSSSLRTCVSALSSLALSVQPLSFQPVTHYSSQRHLLNPFAINPLRTLFISTRVYPPVVLPSRQRSSRMPIPCSPSSLFSIPCALSCTFLHSPKTQLFYFQAIPHSASKNTTTGRGKGYISVLQFSSKFSPVKVGNSLRSRHASHESPVTSHRSPVVSG
jgi:hypothetical protein